MVRSSVGRLVTRHDLSHRLLLVVIIVVSRRGRLSHLLGSHTCRKGCLTWDACFSFLGPPPGRELLWFASLARLKSASQLTISSFIQPTCQLKSASRLMAPTSELLVIKCCLLTSPSVGDSISHNRSLWPKRATLRMVLI